MDEEIERLKALRDKARREFITCVKAWADSREDLAFQRNSILQSWQWLNLLNEALDNRVYTGKTTPLADELRAITLP